MGSNSTPSSHASIISIDPAVASQITGTTLANSSLPGHSRTGSSPAKRNKTSDIASRGHTRNKSVPIAADKKQSNSLRRAKNSTEVLRQRSNRSTKKPTKLDTIPDTREGRNFTVGNVGTGGVLYLKPSALQNVSAQTSPPTLMPLTAPADLPGISSNDENARPLAKKTTRSHSPSTVVRSTSPKIMKTRVNRRPTIETVRSKHKRSQSFSTIDEQRPSFNGTRSKTLKIVINRPGTAQTTAQENDHEDNPLALPTLEVPIPHYRIGTPRFSEYGTPMLRNSQTSRTSATPSETNRLDVAAQQKSLGKGPPPSNQRLFARLQSPQELGLDLRTRPQTSDSARTDSTIREPIHPEIFDALAEVYDDPSVVRYSETVREITAATPARIIAQISSESFMDYELVSDFFLTFRSYMSIYNVLDLLLARLRWAINRQEDDGRIIRVRTFAALRHWILNYFLDDFMTDRKLRVRFCEEINRMYREVASRPGNGTSDLKVLRDLKRCWNGRYSMYWDPIEFSIDQDLQPGGLDELEPVEQPDGGVPPLPQPHLRQKTYSNSSWFEMPSAASAKVQQEKQVSTGKQGSVGSEHSLQAKSCTIPKNLLRGNPDSINPEAGAHPVPVQLRRSGAPSNLQVQVQPTGHRRAAASIDSDREPTPRNLSMTSLQLLQGASIIRGSVYGPSAPFVQIVSSPSTPAMARFETSNLQSNSVRRGGSPASAHAPGVKNIFGSLRKALAGRHGNSDMALVTVSSPIPIQPEQPHQRTPLPLNMSKSHDELRSRAPAAPPRGQIRIDLLCAQVSQNYELLFPHERRATQNMAAAPPLVIRPPGAVAPVDPALLTPDLRRDRLPSHTTAQSGSILIVNDTGMGMPAMSGALYSQPDLLPDHPHTEPLPQKEFGLGIAHPRASRNGATTQRSSDALGEVNTTERIPSPDIQTPRQVTPPELSSPATAYATSPRNMPSTIGSSSTAHRRTYQSSAGGDTGAHSPDETVTSVSAHNPEDEEDEEYSTMPAHGLRRRPGGDLRKVENVQELDHPTHHESLATITTAASGSPIHSFIADGRPATQPSRPPGKKPVSMINTHSSQHLRPSFEAAVKGFSDIPDDDDGGLEATLLKLEGRYEKSSPPLDQHPIDSRKRRMSMPEIGPRPSFDDDDDVAEAPLVPRAPLYGPNVTTVTTVDYDDETMEPEASSRRSSIFGLPTGSVEGSDDSFDPRRLPQQDERHYATTSSGGKVVPSPLHLQKSFASNQPMADEPDYRESMQRPVTAAESNQSFLLDEDENLSDLSSEISVDIINYTQTADQSISPMLAAPGTALSGLEIPSHPLTYASVVNLAPPSEKERASTVMRHSKLMQDVRPSGLVPPPQQVSRISGGPAHIPFILACDSQVLAQQLTLIEKSALTEIEWSDLVERRWESITKSKLLDWAEYLAKEDAKGVDLVVTRFNLVSKWVRSEIVLTQNLEERAQVIAKYIHVAAHARRLHNYATMVQITVGLTSTDCTRLTKTWEKVPGPDRSLLKNMERLVNPIRNFHELRVEIESADFSDGCIPFLGLYIRDLTYNAQKPGQIATRGLEPLINFERFRTAAVIVKGLLRLIDASARYVFEPQKGIIERCLWLACLSDEKIYTLSRALEQ